MNIGVATRPANSTSGTRAVNSTEGPRAEMKAATATGIGPLGEAELEGEDEGLSEGEVDGLILEEVLADSDEDGEREGDSLEDGEGESDSEADGLIEGD